MSDVDTPEISASAQRSRELRRRRKLGLRVAAVEVSPEQVAILVRDGLLGANQTDDMAAISAALQAFFARAIEARSDAASDRSSSSQHPAATPDADGCVTITLRINPVGRDLLCEAGLLRPELRDSSQAVRRAVNDAAVRYLNTLPVQEREEVMKHPQACIDWPPPPDTSRVIPPLGTMPPRFGTGMNAGTNIEREYPLETGEGTGYRMPNIVPGQNRQIGGR